MPDIGAFAGPAIPERKNFQAGEVSFWTALNLRHDGERYRRSTAASVSSSRAAQSLARGRRTDRACVLKQTSRPGHRGMIVRPYRAAASHHIHRSRRTGRIPLRLAKTAEPLLIKAVISGLTSPPGTARPRATVFIAATTA